MSISLNLSPNATSFEFLEARELLEAGDNLTFSRLIGDSYRITDWISEDYPDHCRHFYTKYVPGIFTGERNIIAVYSIRGIAGTVILKKDEEECKISTLYVLEAYRGQHLSTNLLERSFEWLGTEKPLITIADYKLSQFTGIINRYGWQETDILSAGFYNTHSREHVFNGES